MARLNNKQKQERDQKIFFEWKKGSGINFTAQKIGCSNDTVSKYFKKFDSGFKINCDNNCDNSDNYCDIDLTNFSYRDLKNLLKNIKQEIQLRKTKLEQIEEKIEILDAKSYRIEFNIDSYKWRPYVARLYLDSDNRLERDFVVSGFDAIEDGKGIFHLEQSFIGKENEIYDIKFEDERWVCMIYEGKLTKIFEYKKYDKSSYWNVVQYLRGTVSKQTFLQYFEIIPIEQIVMEELWDDEE